VRQSSWPATVVLAAFGAFSISFFFASMAPTPIARFAGLLTGGWYTLLLVLMLRSGKPGTWRRVFFVSIALFFFPEFMSNVVDMRGHITVNPEDVVNGAVPYCHIVNVMAIIPLALSRTVIFPGRLMGFYASVYSMLTLWLVSSLIIGRGWCAWMCFFGGWDDGASRSSRKVRLPLLGKEKKIREFNQGMMVFVILASMSTMTAVYCVWLCPFKIITEYELISGIGSFLATIMFILLFFGLTMVLPHLTQKRMQCSTLCPLGPLQAIIDRITPFGIRIDAGRCSRCMACVKACPTLSLDEELIRSGQRRPHHSCAKCGDCVQLCPRQAVSFSLRPADWVRRRFGLDTAAGAAAADSPAAAGSPGAADAGAQVPSLGLAFRRAAMRAGDWALALGRELLEPRHLFTVTAFILGCALSYTFAMGSISRLANLILSGSFIRGY
jgi:polyferredoxin